MRTSLLFLTVLMLGILPVSAVVNLYYTPNVAEAPAVIVDDDNPIIASAQPATDEAARADGWSTVERPGKYRGFVDIVQIDKSLGVKVGAPVYLKPEEGSLVITTIGPGDKSQVLWQGDYWEVEFEKTLPLFVKPPRRSPPAMLPSAGAATVATPARPAALPSPLNRPAGAQPPTRPNQTAITSGNAAEGLAMDFNGTLQRSRAIALVMEPPLPHELIGSDGERIAYVDFRQALISQPIDTFLGKRVIIYGYKSNLAESDKLVIKARSIRFR